MNFKRMLLISRPLFWIITGASYLFGLRNLTNFSYLTILEFLFFLFPLNFYVYGINDLYDLKSDRKNPRKGGAQGALLKNSELPDLKRWLFVFPILFLMIASLSLNIEHILLSTCFIFLGFAYSHRSLRFKDIPIIDSFTSSIGYALPALIAFSLNKSTGKSNTLPNSTLNIPFISDTEFCVSLHKDVSPIESA